MRISRFALLFASTFFVTATCAQNTLIKGFVDVNTILRDGKVSFNLGEQDFFITSELSDRFSFLGESVFRFSPNSPTTFDVSIERIVLKYNVSGNHNLLVGKHHTPLNYWNDTYHHGRVFFPTIGRPLLFGANIIPLHTTGFSVQGHNLGEARFGYDFLIGNGIGSNDVVDNDKAKSITAAIHAKPIENFRVGLSYYNDRISQGAKVHDGHELRWATKQQIGTVSVAYFGKPVELLSEASFAFNKTDTTGRQTTTALYTYAGIKLGEKWVPYIRFDYIQYPEGEVFYTKDNARSYIVGIRYIINYLAVVKLEYQYEKRQLTGSGGWLQAQVAIGF